jgi:hypothetical protein
VLKVFLHTSIPFLPSKTQEECPIWDFNELLVVLLLTQKALSSFVWRFTFPSFSAPRRRVWQYGQPTDLGCFRLHLPAAFSLMRAITINNLQVFNHFSSLSQFKDELKEN